MVTKTKRPEGMPTSKRSPVSKRTADAAPPAPASPSVEPAKPNLLRAGLKALGNVRDDVVQHQSRVFEAILGIDPAQGWSGLIKRDPVAAQPRKSPMQETVGLRKFEAVFDERVANALERIGMPSMKSVKALEKEVASLRDEVAELKSELRGKPKKQVRSVKTLAQRKP